MERNCEKEGMKGGGKRREGRSERGTKKGELKKRVKRGKGSESVGVGDA